MMMPERDDNHSDEDLLAILSYEDLPSFLRDTSQYYALGHLFHRTKDANYRIGQEGLCEIILPVMGDRLRCYAQVSRRVPDGIVLTIQRWEPEHAEQLWRFVAIAWPMLRASGFNQFKGRPPTPAAKLNLSTLVSTGQGAEIERGIEESLGGERPSKRILGYLHSHPDEGQATVAQARAAAALREEPDDAPAAPATTAKGSSPLSGAAQAMASAFERASEPAEAAPPVHKPGPFDSLDGIYRYTPESRTAPPPESTPFDDGGDSLSGIYRYTPPAPQAPAAPADTLGPDNPIDGFYSHTPAAADPLDDDEGFYLHRPQSASEPRRYPEPDEDDEPATFYSYRPAAGPEHSPTRLSDEPGSYDWGYSPSVVDEPAEGPDAFDFTRWERQADDPWTQREAQTSAAPTPALSDDPFSILSPPQQSSWQPQAAPTPHTDDDAFGIADSFFSRVREVSADPFTHDPFDISDLDISAPGEAPRPERARPGRPSAAPNSRQVGQAPRPRGRHWDLRRRSLPQLMADSLKEERTGWLAVISGTTARRLRIEDGQVVQIEVRPRPDARLWQAASAALDIPPGVFESSDPRWLRQDMPEAFLLEGGVLETGRAQRLLGRRLSLQLSRALDEGWQGEALFESDNRRAGSLFTLAPSPSVPLARLVWTALRSQAERADTRSRERFLLDTLQAGPAWNPRHGFALEEIAPRDYEAQIISALERGEASTLPKLGCDRTDLASTLWCLVQLKILQLPHKEP